MQKSVINRPRPISKMWSYQGNRKVDQPGEGQASPCLANTGLLQKKGQREKLHKVGCLLKLIMFYNSPKVIFSANCMSYIAFLMLFSHILLSNFHPEFRIADTILCAWVFTFFMEEIRQMITHTGKTLLRKVVSYLEFWNTADMFAIIVFAIGMTLRLAPFKNTFMAARVLLALDLVLFYMRLLHIFFVHKELGPKLVMIARMMNDLLYFISIMVVFLIAYGVASMAILYPNTPFSARLVKGVLYNAYFQMYGELFLESIEGTDCSSIAAVWQTGALPRCPELSNVVLCLLALYLLLTNILLFNLLIAMFRKQGVKGWLPNLVICETGESTSGSLWSCFKS
ncbi:PREDICTED: transient receptor potential cation channel subfamily M member 5-like [Priapulus caudatus]|uniref:Transient receptor potential cation channel subfamily M member 5-like n=1 Tax=Priapulus caudatus TaxID=37621 RepID=A0ABM1EB51_PRICU|nr:PREDICTED: transient receptor potential cation channel subfamily M member 5-like [Priapulus caudatus]